MHWLDRAGFELASDAYDHAVTADPEIDRFCSRSAWVLSFHEAFHPRAELFAAREGGDFVALASIDEPGIGAVLQPLEAMWGFASALVGAGSSELLRSALELRARRSAATPLLLTGLPSSRSRLAPLIRALEPRFALRPVAPTVRYQASLEGGVDGWLSRRSARFRRNLRVATRRTREAGIRFELASPADPDATGALYERALGVERHSWKARSGNGVASGPMREFYARMLPRLASRRALRVLLATRDGVDVGYLYGGVFERGFRGLQFSFHDELSGLGLGNALQAEILERLCAEGIASYDLGSQSEYKRHWAEAGLVTVGLLGIPRS
ncbi:MAG: GNAT family N-acetyltransferase [Deltaproteobacteria bacterium]|nr:GNAT family N-acetyltransferase [Deltaproteobacteria bacterium]